MNKEALDAMQMPPLWLHASAMVPPGPSCYLYSVVSSKAILDPRVVGATVAGLLEQYTAEYPEADLATLVLTIEPDGVHHRLTVQSALRA
jgi:hypothetical protein